MHNVRKLIYLILISSIVFFSVLNQRITIKAVNSLNYILLSKYKANINIGEEFNILAITSNGKLATWKSSDSKIASVNTYGKVTAKKAGTVTITGKIKGAEASCIVVVKKTKVTISNSKAELERGETFHLSAFTSNNSSVAWKSSKKSIATVDDKGLITAIKPGETIITATANGSSDYCKLIVKTPTIKLNNSKVKLYRGGEKQIVATVSSNISPTWKSNKKSVATIDANGIITAHKHGTTIITASLDGVSKICEVIVEQPIIELSTSELNIKKGKVSVIKAKVSSGNAPTWSTSNPNIISIDSNGNITALQKGSAYVYASEDGIKMRCKVNVTE